METESFLFKKNVDKSLLKAGLTIPKDSYSKLLEAVQVTLTKGEKTDLTVFIEDNSYKVTLTNVNLDENISTGKSCRSVTVKAAQFAKN